MKRIPEICVFLALPLVGLIVYMVTQIMFWDGGALEVDILQVMAAGPERETVWASPPGPIRDVTWAGPAGGGFAVLASLLALTVIRSAILWARDPARKHLHLGRASRAAGGIAVLAALLSIATCTHGLAGLFADRWGAASSPPEHYMGLAPGLASLRLGAGIAATALGVALLSGLAAFRAPGGRG